MANEEITAKTDLTPGVLYGIDLILSLNGVALGYSTGCKVTTTADTGERLTKEATAAGWKEKYIKSFNQEISAEGCVLESRSEGTPTYEEFMDLMLTKEPVDVSYGVRGEGREGSEVNYHRGKFLITSCDLDAQAGEDAKYTIKLENTGAVARVGNGISK